MKCCGCVEGKGGGNCERCRSWERW
ncbi:hypothetical protein ACFW04_005610 [Cataglyphis niger]